MDCTTAPIACQLDRIADAMTGFDWNGFVATLLATVVGACVAAFIGFVVARAERPQPFFQAETDEPLRGAGWPGPEGGDVGVRIHVWNIGDGPAYNVRFTAAGSAYGGSEFTVAKLEPGSSLDGLIGVPGHGGIEFNRETMQSDDLRSVTWPSNAAVLISWQQPPQRRRVRHARLSISSPLPETAARS